MFLKNILNDIKKDKSGNERPSGAPYSVPELNLDRLVEEISVMVVQSDTNHIIKYSNGIFANYVQPTLQILHNDVKLNYLLERLNNTRFGYTALYERQELVSLLLFIVDAMIQIIKESHLFIQSIKAY